VPLHLRNATTGVTKALGHGRGYRYAHAHAGGVVEQEHLPEALRGHRYYTAGDQGAEAELVRRLAELRARAGQATGST